MISDPNNPKFQRLKLSNKVIKGAILEIEQSCYLLELLGFEK